MSIRLLALDAEMGALVGRVRASLVEIKSGRTPRRAGSGTGAGTIWHPDGLVITNAHVVRHPQGSPVWFSRWGRDQVRREPEEAPVVTLADGRQLPARVLAYDEELDLAAIALDLSADKLESSPLPTIELGESTRLRAGEWVMALGHPWGVAGAVSGGVVIGVGSDWGELPRRGQEWIAASLQLRPGHSGGPLVDAHGRLVGINTMMAGPEVGLAVPVHEVKRFLRQTLG